jgi:hypothetical protein
MLLFWRSIGPLGDRPGLTAATLDLRCTGRASRLPASVFGVGCDMPGIRGCRRASDFATGNSQLRHGSRFGEDS